MWESTIIDVLKEAARSAQISREAFADRLELIAGKIRKGNLISDETFAEAKRAAERFDHWGQQPETD